MDSRRLLYNVSFSAFGVTNVGRLFSSQSKGGILQAGLISAEKDGSHLLRHDPNQLGRQSPIQGQRPLLRNHIAECPNDAGTLAVHDTGLKRAIKCTC